MVVMRWSDPYNVAAYDMNLAEVTVGSPQRLSKRIELCDYDQTWPELYAKEAARMTSALGHRVVRLEHVGSTAVLASCEWTYAAVRGRKDRRHHRQS
jgi:hypothetical protein